MKKRIFSILLVCCMVLALLPTTALAENGGGVAVDHINFPDSMFRTFIQTSLDINHDGVLSEEEIAATVTIDCTYRPIQDLTGIEHFTALKTLKCHNTHLISLDVSKNTALEELDCSETPLTSLNVSKNVNLRSLACMRTKLSSLDVSHNVNLKSLNTEQTPLGTLDVTRNTALEFLNCFGNNLTTIDVSENTALVTLYCASNQLTEIDVTGNTALQHLDFGQNNLTSIDLTRNVNLLTVSYNQNPVTTLDVSRNTALKELHCTFTPLTSLDISKNTALEKLNCLGVQLTELDVRQNTALTFLECFDNQLTELDVSRNTALRHLSCGYNRLTELDVRQNTALERLECNKNQLTTLDVRQNTALEDLRCSENQLTSLDVSQNVNLELFICTGNAYPIAVGENRTFALSTLPEGFEIEKAGNWTGGTVSDGILTVDEGATEVTYAYDCGSSKPVTFKLTLTDGCTVTFDTDGGSAVESQTVVSGQKAVRPADPVRTGYTFAGWYLDGEVYDFDTPVTTDLTLTAQWTVNQYTITFDTAGGSAIAPITQDYGTPITAPADPTRNGYTFVGWSPALPATMPAENLTVTAQWTVNQYTITFDTDGGSAIAPITQDYGTAITAPAAPTKTGYTFTGWEPELPATMPAENMTITAQWTINQYTITFDTAGGSAIAPITQDYGTAITAPADPTRNGYTFVGWSPALPATMPAENMTVTAQWRVNRYTITYDLDRGTADDNPTGYTVETETFTLKNPTRPGYIFSGWSGTGLTGEDNLTVTIPKGSTGNRSYTAHWRYNGGYRYYTIKATAGAGGSISPYGNVSVREGSDRTFTITPDKGYAVSNVKIDGKSIGAVRSYTFENVRHAHTIEVSFMKAGGSPQTGVFVDVATGSYYEDAVDWAVENGITTGVSANRFDPNGVCTRAQAVTFLWRAAGSPAPRSRTMPFTDVPAGSYYYDAVLWAVENGITKGTSDTRFSPDATCSRAQIVAFLWRSEKSPAASSRNPFTDVKPGAYYLDAVLWAVESGITKGTTAMKFGPDADCTRAQIVTFLWRCKK